MNMVSIKNVQELHSMYEKQVEDKVASLVWDGEPRVKGLLSKTFKMPNSGYLEGVGTYIMTALAGRQLKTGCKADMLPVLVGRRGVGKSSFIKALTILGEGGFKKLNTACSTYELSRLCEGSVIVEVQYLQDTPVYKHEALVNWAVAQTDSLALKYQRLNIEKPRHFFAIATANTKYNLEAHEVRKRLLPIDLTHINRHGLLPDIDYVKENIEQLWAEGAFLFNKNGAVYHCEYSN